MKKKLKALQNARNMFIAQLVLTSLRICTNYLQGRGPFGISDAQVGFLLQEVLQDLEVASLGRFVDRRLSFGVGRIDRARGVGLHPGDQFHHRARVPTSNRFVQLREHPPSTWEGGRLPVHERRQFLRKPVGFDLVVVNQLVQALKQGAVVYGVPAVTVTHDLKVMNRIVRPHGEHEASWEPRAVPH